jgi:glyoxylase-like metal-dependent hydrolase (beta-lactamase superfamily II)
MDGSTVVIAPPDGDMAAYLASLQRVLDLGTAAIAPGHGRLITDPEARVRGYLAHRLEREQQVLAALDHPMTVDELVAAIYVGVPDALLPVARYSGWAHLRKLSAEGRVTTDDDPGDIHAQWR